MIKTTVVIDGSNFYHGCKHLCPDIHLTNFNYRKLVEGISRKDATILYCVGEIKKVFGDKKSEQMYAQQQSLFYSLEKQNILIYKGFMLKNDGKYHEKGVDVKIAVEIVAGALKNKYDECYLFSSDTDIIPAIEEAKNVGKKIIYVGFEKRLSRAMVKNCSKTIAISEKVIREMDNKK